MVYTETATFNHDTFNYERADEEFRKAYEAYVTHEFIYGKLDEADYRREYLNLNYARNLCALNMHGEAITLLSNQLALQDSVHGPASRQSLKTLQGLISAYCAEGPSPRLDALFARYAATADPKSVALAPYDDLTVRIGYYSASGDYPRAIETINRGLTEDLSTLQKIDLSCRLEKLMRETATQSEYLATCAGLIEPLKRDVVKSLIVLNDGERQSLLRPLQQFTDGLIAGGATDEALEMSLFRKGLLFSTKQSMEKRLATNRKTRDDFRRLVVLRTRLNDAIAFGDTIHMPQLRTDITRLERKLNLALAADEGLFPSVDRTLGQVRAKLGEGDVAVDLIQYDDNATPAYAAFIIRREGEAVFVRLGTEQEVTSDPTLMQSQLLPYMTDATDVFICPDGALHNLPIEYQLTAVPPTSSRYDLSSHRTHRVFHLADMNRELSLALHSPDSGIVLIGVSDHNSPVGDGETLYRGSFTDIPFVKDEMAIIRNRMADFRPLVMFNDEALEENVKGLTKGNPRLLHISTHGFYLGAKALNESMKDPAHFDHNVARRVLTANRTSVAGLVLRRGNLSWKMRDILDDEDDILTAEEIENLSFPELQLTVLSACETGLGDIDPEGVRGLQRAFRIAGTKSLICALRKIPDYETTLFMDAFYEKVAAGATVYDSFQYARRVLVDEYPDHPEIGASFILIE